MARFGKLKADEWSRIKNRKRKEKEESVQKELESSGGWSCERCGAENLAWRTKCYTCSGKPPQDYEAPAGEERHYEKRHRGGRKHRKTKKVRRSLGVRPRQMGMLGLGPEYSSDPSPFAQAMAIEPYRAPTVTVMSSAVVGMGVAVLRWIKQAGDYVEESLEEGAMILREKAEEGAILLGKIDPSQTAPILEASAQGRFIKPKFFTNATVAARVRLRKIQI